ncbi:MAG: hypothetical protein IH623_15010 [Verrucomicrobia bacterium]|nr:hypothetical protein [Verrucomicrobiota bacterium]
MKKIISLLSVAMLMSSAVAFGATPVDNMAGDWGGTLQAGSSKLRVVFKISKGDRGALTAKMDSIDQGAHNIPVDTVTLKDKTLRMEVKAVQGVYEGTLDAAGMKATGQWTQGPQSLPLILEKRQGTNSPFAGEKIPSADLAANKQAAVKLAGTWNGALAAGGTSLRLRLNITKTSNGEATGTMDSLDQGANGIPLSALTFKDGKVRFEARGIGGVYEGTLATEGDTLSGQWQQGGQTLPLNFKKATAK